MAEFNLNRAIRGASLGLATAANALSAAKVQALQAKTQQQQLEAQRALEQARIDVQRELIASRERSAAQQIESTERIAEQNRLVSERIKKLDLAGRLDQIEAQLSGQKDIVGLQTSSAKDIATTQATTQQAIATGQQQTARDIATTQATTQRDIATGEQATRLDVANVQRQTALDTARIGARVSLTQAEYQKELAESQQRLNTIIENAKLGIAQSKNDTDRMLAGRKGADDLRQELIRHPQTRDFIEVRNAHDRIKAAAVDPSAAGDLALIFNYMKMLDPGSVVRESEFATAQNAAGVPDRIRNIYNRVLNGERLATDQRADFVSRASALFDGMEARQIQLENDYKRLAMEIGGDPARVALPSTVGTSPAVGSPSGARMTPEREAEYIRHLQESVRAGENQADVLQRGLGSLSQKYGEDYILELHRRAFP